MKICPQCGKEFQSTLSYRKYCSEECRKEAALLQNKMSKARCRETRAAKARIKKICAWCGKEFEAPLSQANKKYCSEECYYEALRKISRENSAQSRAAAKLKPKVEPKVEGEIDEFTRLTREAEACNLDYGTYRGLRALGKTFEELKAQGELRAPRVHQSKGRVQKKEASHLEGARRVQQHVTDGW